MATVNIAPDSTPTCDSQYSDAYSCDKAIDELVATRWLSGSVQPHHIELYWPVSKDIVQVRFFVGDFGGEHFTEYYIEYYDGSWHEAVHVTGFSTYDEWVSHDVEFTCTILRFRTTAGESYTNLCELEAYAEIPLAKLSGTVKEKGAAVVRTVRSYVRSTGVLYSTGQSGAGGAFSIDAPDDTTEMYVIALDDDAGDQYNALIFDRVKGVFP
ncbi:hypothetical protein ES702_02939 [subsurface metagenome]